MTNKDGIKFVSILLALTPLTLFADQPQPLTSYMATATPNNNAVIPATTPPPAPAPTTSSNSLPTPTSTMNAYTASAPPAPALPPPEFHPGLYISAQAGYSFMKVNNITNTNSATTAPMTSSNTTTATAFTPGVALGYQFRSSGPLSRIELDYMHRSDVSYNASPFLAFSSSEVGSSINSNIDSDDVLLKGFYDFDYFNSPFIPYIQAGLGAARNSTSSKATLTLLPGFTDNGSGDGASTNFAWDAGAGVRAQVTNWLYLDFGYEFDDLGSANWDIHFPAQTFSEPLNVNLKSDRIYSNTVYAAITIAPTWLGGSGNTNTN